VSFELLEAEPWTCRVDGDGAPMRVRIAYARGNGGGSGHWRGCGRCPSAVPERRCNLGPARQRKDRAHRNTGSASNHNTVVLRITSPAPLMGYPIPRDFKDRFKC